MTVERHAGEHLSSQPAPGDKSHREDVLNSLTATLVVAIGACHPAIHTPFSSLDPSYSLLLILSPVSCRNLPIYGPYIGQGTGFSLLTSLSPFPYKHLVFALAAWLRCLTPSSPARWTTSTLSLCTEKWQQGTQKAIHLTNLVSISKQLYYVKSVWLQRE